MTDLEISRALALAIGWKTVLITRDMCIVQTGDGISKVKVGSKWVYGRLFDYRNPDVIWPIAERYDAFPVKQRNGNWRAFIGHGGAMEITYTAAKAVALVVIGSAS